MRSDEEKLWQGYFGCMLLLGTAWLGFLIWAGIVIVRHVTGG